jgi:hypothetical protein
MLRNTKCHLIGLTTLAVTLAAPSYVAFAEPTTDAVTSNSDASAANYGRAGGRASLSTEPTQPPQVLVDAYEQTKASVERAYEKSKQFLVDSAHGRVGDAQASVSEQAEGADRMRVTSGNGIGAFGRAGTRDYLSSAPPRPVPEVLSNAYEKTTAFVKHAYEKTSEFLTQSSQRSTTGQPGSVSGS